MIFRTTTLTATLALALGAGSALAQQETVITVPLGDTVTAPAAQDGFSYTATPTTDGAAEVATPTGPAPAQATGTLLSPPRAVIETQQAGAAQAPAAAPPPVAAAQAPAAEAAAGDDAAPAEAPAAAEATDAAPADTATATAPAEGEAAAAPEEAADVSSDDPAAAVEGDVVTATGDSEAPVEGESDAALGTVSEADTAAQESEAENQAARTAGENVAEGVDETAAEAPAEPAAAHQQHITDVAFSFEGPFGKYDQFQLQRGLQVYTEVCASCHGMRYVPLRTLSDANGPGLPVDQVRAYAAEMSVTDSETGEERPRLPTDNFPIVAGEGMGPDLSLMAKARAGFHGPYGTGVNQFFKGMGGPEYIYSILEGYTEETKDEAGSTFYENAAFPGGWIQMPPPLSEDLVTYADGTPATVDNMAKDVSAFLMWAAEPKMMERKQTGLVSVLFLIVLSALLYLTNKRLWWPVKHGRPDEGHR